MTTIILPEVVRSKEVFIAAAYMLATETKSARDIIFLPKEGQESNLYSDEVKQKISQNFSCAFSNLISLHLQSKVCDPIIDSSKDSIDAIQQVADALEKDYVPIS